MGRDLVPSSDAREPDDRPRVVEEAEEVLDAYGLRLAAAGVVGGVAWSVAATFLPGLVPIPWLVGFFALLAALFFFPVTREPRLARDVLRRWDDLRVDKALEDGGLQSDPRLLVAESMAERVLRHPTVEDRVRVTVRELIRRIRILLRDLRRVDWLGQTRSIQNERSRARSIADLHDILDARIASILGTLAEIHRTVVLHDAIALDRAMEGVEELLRTLEAEREVDRLLAQADRD